ncbi:MAG: hypothetical protein GEU86_10335 [Actinophytocola sp.]|nr:hypothetical protein [Actinophytocola sp.]
MTYEAAFEDLVDSPADPDDLDGVDVDGTFCIECGDPMETAGVCEECQELLDAPDTDTTSPNAA